MALLRIKQVMEAVGLGRSTIYAKVKDGSFVRPIHLSARATRWDSEEIRAWIQAFKDERCVPA